MGEDSGEQLQNPEGLERTPRPGGVVFERKDESTLLVRLAGDWRLADGLPPAAELQEQLTSAPGIQHIAFDTRELGDWDTGFLTYLRTVVDTGSERGIAVATDGLPQGVRRLLALASAVPEKKDAQKSVQCESILSIVGTSTISFVQGAREMLDFIGEVALALSRFVRGRARFRRVDLTLLIQECGVQALPIVTLISILIGMVLAFIGAVQLQMFGAEIFVANLVGIGMARELAPLMSAIIMAGRTGGAYAAQLGTMQVNEEIDAFSTFGFSPMDFLVLPRMLALFLMMPLLCVYANLMGIFGGAIVGVGLLDLPLKQYFDQVQASVRLTDFSQGLFKSAVFGVVIAVSGCFHGIRCGRSASAVGTATTAAVVMGIILIVLSDAVIDVIIQVLGI